MEAMGNGIMCGGLLCAGFLTFFSPEFAATPLILAGLGAAIEYWSRP